MKQRFLHFFLLVRSSALGQSQNTVFRFNQYDSVLVQTFNDYTHELDFKTGESFDTIIYTGQAKLKTEDVTELLQRMQQKKAFGEHQAMTPVYDLQFLFYQNGNIQEKVEISLWTNNLFASFPLEVQRQGDCLCDGTGGYCCSKGGISKRFKSYLVKLLQSYQLPVEQEGME